jgi:hypothetical protein
MTDVQKQITLLTKQNEGMETSFTHKGVQFTKLSIENGDEPEVMLTLLTEYNIYLKNISKTNRPQATRWEDTPWQDGAWLSLSLSAAGTKGSEGA